MNFSIEFLIFFIMAFEIYTKFYISLVHFFFIGNVRGSAYFLCEQHGGRHAFLKLDYKKNLQPLKPTNTSKLIVFSFILLRVDFLRCS